jgi:hypothetical protein
MENLGGDMNVKLHDTVAFYTYLWLREDGTPYYAGKATRLRRAYDIHHRVKLPPRERIIVQEFETEDDALFAERFLIATYGRLDLSEGCLANLTDGGEGHRGLIRSQSAIEKHRQKMLGHVCKEETRAKISAAQTGTNNPSYKVKGENHWNRGLARSENTREKIRTSRAKQDMSSRIKTHCKRGHLRAQETVSANGTCLECKKIARDHSPEAKRTKAEYDRNYRRNRHER